MKYIVEYPGEYYLRGTTATGSIERAQRFDSEEQARAKLQANAKFIKPAARRSAKIISIKE